MTRVRLTCPANVAGGFHERGDVVQVDDDVADNLVDLGRAVRVEAKIEHAVRAVSETTARTAARTRTRTRRDV